MDIRKALLSNKGMGDYAESMVVDELESHADFAERLRQ
jgi:hypothetical protein